MIKKMKNTKNPLSVKKIPLILACFLLSSAIGYFISIEVYSRPKNSNTQELLIEPNKINRDNQ